MSDDLGEAEKRFLDRVDDAIREALKDGVEPLFLASSMEALQDRIIRDFSAARAEEMVERILQGESADDVLNDIIGEVGETPQSFALNPEDLSQEEVDAMKTLGYDPESAEVGEVVALDVTDPTEAEREALKTLGFKV